MTAFGPVMLEAGHNPGSIERNDIDMTLVEGLNELKAQGITKLVGMAGITDIDTYLEHATENHENAVKYAEMGIQTWQYELDHEGDSFMAEADGHHIIATIYSTADGKQFDMATYSDYETEEEMYAAFDEWKIAQQAAEIADEKVKQDSSLPRGVCPKHKEEPQCKGTMCLAWVGDEIEKARRVAEGKWYK